MYTPHFNPRPPWGGRLSEVCSWKPPVENFNPRPPWGGRQAAAEYFGCSDSISIHALRGEGDFEIAVSVPPSFAFQSTPSVGRATRGQRLHAKRNSNFNPRPPWGGRREDRDYTQKEIAISIHALRGEGDRCAGTATKETSYFNPRPPWGGRRLIVRPKLRPLVISIHALRGEGD